MVMKYILPGECAFHLNGDGVLTASKALTSVRNELFNARTTLAQAIVDEPLNNNKGITVTDVIESIMADITALEAIETQLKRLLESNNI